MPSAPVTLAVTAASGGLGASTLAAACARRLAVTAGESTLVDLDLDGGGLDVTVGLEHAPGHRWGDLSDLAGRAHGRRLRALLPSAADCAVLSAGGTRPGTLVPEEAVVAVLDGLAAGPCPVVLDLPAKARPPSSVLERVEVAVLVIGLGVRALADAEAAAARLRAHLPESAATWLVTSGGATARAGRPPLGRSARRAEPARPRRGVAGPPDELVDALTRHLGAPYLGHLRPEREVARAGERGEWPDLGSPRRVAARVVEVLARPAARDGTVAA